MAGLTNKEFESICCAHCGKPFRTYPKSADKTGPGDVPYIDGGLITLSAEDGEELHYHGYYQDRSCCYWKANPEG